MLQNFSQVLMLCILSVSREKLNTVHIFLQHQSRQDGYTICKMLRLVTTIQEITLHILVLKIIIECNYDSYNVIQLFRSYW